MISYGRGETTNSDLGNDMKPIVAVAIAIAANLMPSSSLCADNYKVAVTVAADAVGSNELQSCLNRELRGLGDVMLVNSYASEPRFSLQVVLMQPKTESGGSPGLVASMVVLDHRLAQWLVGDRRPGSILSKAEPELFYGVGDIATHYVMADKTVTALCERIVANFDVDAIELARREDAETAEKLRQLKEDQGS
jgi:hypothetical protein